MTTQLNGSSYYRANPFYQQGYLPDSAFKNRKQPSFMVQIPQGNQYFEPTNKKHFQRVGYYSTIAQQGIINKQPISSPARQKQYFRSLNVQDIEGTSTNTLISQAIKNRLKAKEQLAQRMREQEYQQARQKRQYYHRMQDQTKRMQALAKINRKGEPNYHQKVMKLKTQQSETNLSPDIKRVQNSQIQNYHNQKYEKFKKQLHKTQSQIRQLERQLRQGNQQVKNENMHQYQNLPSKQSQSQMLNDQINQKQQRQQKQLQKKYQYKKVLSNKSYTPFQEYQQINPGRSSNQELLNKSNKLHSVGMPPQNQFYLYSQPPANLQNKNESNRQRSYTEKAPNIIEKRGNSYGIINSEEGTNPQLIKIEQENPPTQSKAQIIKKAKEQHRRQNPTYLSYGSPSIGLAGRNIVGY